MAIATILGPVQLDLGAALEADPISVNSNSTQAVYTYADGSTITAYGSFTSFSGGRPTAGTFTGLTYVSGSSSITITDASLSVSQVNTLLDAGNTDGFFDLLLAGADTIYGNAADNDLGGGNGADTIYSGGGTDILNGEAGNDTIVLNGMIKQYSSFDGGAGTDTLRITPASMVLIGSQYFALPSGSTINGFERLHMASELGQDVSAVFLVGQLNQFTTLAGGAGKDVVIALVPSGGGAYSLDPFALQTWSAEDMVVMTVGSGTGNFTLNASAHTAGLQALVGGVGNDTLNGSSGKDILDGRGGTNTVFGLGGDDRIVGGVGTDTIDAGDGNDLVEVNGTNLSGVNYQGGAGTDTLQFNLTARTTTANGPLVLAAPMGLSGFEKFQFASTVDGPLTAIFRLDQASGVTTLIGGDGTDGAIFLAPSGGGTFNLKAFNMVDWQAGDLVGLVVGNGTGAYTLNANVHANTYLLGGGGGNDKLNGTDGLEILNGNDGDDILNPRGGADVIDGGAGFDTLTYASAAAGVSIRLDVATAQSTGGGGKETISNVEALIGSAFADNLFGTSDANKLSGGVGADRMTGYGGKDLLYGGTDSDIDTFIYTSVDDSAVGSTSRDQIYDFVSLTDKIDLRQIDANTNVDLNQAFKFSATGPANYSIWVVDPGTSLVIKGDVNGDKIADFEIQVMNIDTLASTDFLL